MGRGEGRPSNLRREGDLVYVELSGGKESVIDAIDADKVAGYKWHCVRSGTKVNHRWYARRRIEKGHGQTIVLSRLLLNAAQGEQVDHINGNTLDNRRENLRICTSQQNSQNQKKTPKACTSKYKGVCWNKSSSKWMVYIRPPNEKLRHLGYFDFEVDAAKVYNEEALKLFGEYASLNKIMEVA